jgi:hydrogenase/urease accessory protein HupE
VRDEVGAREATAMGWTGTTRSYAGRLRQKLDFVSDDQTAPREPTEAELAAYLAAHADSFRAETRFTFKQVFLDPGRRGERTGDDAARLLAQLAPQGANADVTKLGDPFLLDAEFTSVTGSDVAMRFGGEFAQSLEKLPDGSWQGPVTSSYGSHLVFIVRREAGEVPTLELARAAVRREWENAERAAAQEAFYQKLLARYTVVIEPARQMKRWVLALLITSAFASSSFAHEVRPGYLQLRQTGADSYDVLWKLPSHGDEPHAGLDVVFPDGTETTAVPTDQLAEGSVTQRWSIRRAGGLAVLRSASTGCATMTDVLVRLERSDGTKQITRLTPDQTSFIVETAPNTTKVAATYTKLGIEHILLGIDHLLYILAMLFLVKGWKRIFWTMTAFTATHSLTLTAAALGWVHVPQAPVEACIALSILFVAAEIVRSHKGQASLTEKWPWVVSFTFGLLHGLGFAGALAEVGLPQADIPVALLFFNVGVEIGQIVFVIAAVAVFAALRRLFARVTIPRRAGPGACRRTRSALWRRSG